MKLRKDTKKKKKKEKIQKKKQAIRNPNIVKI